MPKNNDPEETKKILTREQILSFDTPSKEYELPSGKVVKFKYLSFFMVTEIKESCESAIGENLEKIFTEKVIKWMLRENDEKDYASFSIKDKEKLIDIAVQEWGCEDEFEALAQIENSEVRFYQAVDQQEKKLAEQLSEGFSKITASFAASLPSFTVLQDLMASSVKGILSQINMGDQVSNIFKNISLQTIDQFGVISNMAPSIIGLSEALTLVQSSILLPYEKTLLNNVGKALLSYQSLMKDILPVAKFSILPDAVRYFPTIEMRNTAIATRRLITNRDNADSEEVIVPDADELLVWLSNLDPSFPKMLKGAEQTINSSNTDRSRHFASSHRELCTHLLHLLAPDDPVNRWVTDPNYFQKDGRPTRKARLLFIVRNYKNEHFTDFFIKDFLSQIDLLNADEHGKDHEYSENELTVLHKRFLSTLGFLMEITRSSEV